MYCGQCGTQLADDARFCGICGTPAADTHSSKQKTTTGDGKQAADAHSSNQAEDARAAKPHLALEQATESTDPADKRGKSDALEDQGKADTLDAQSQTGRPEEAEKSNQAANSETAIADMACQTEILGVVPVRNNSDSSARERRSVLSDGEEPFGLSKEQTAFELPDEWFAHTPPRKVATAVFPVVPTAATQQVSTLYAHQPYYPGSSVQHSYPSPVKKHPYALPISIVIAALIIGASVFAALVYSDTFPFPLEDQEQVSVAEDIPAEDITAEDVPAEVPEETPAENIP